MNDVTTNKRRRRRREIRPEVDRRTSAPFNGETVDRAVPDPYSPTGGKIVVTASIRDDPLGQLYARKHIDDAQYLAGIKVRQLFELAEIGSIQAIDPGKEAVDGRGQYVEPITEMQMRASRELAHISSVLGKVGYDLCRAVLAAGMTMETIAAQHGPVNDRTIKYWGKRFRECLQTLAVGSGARGGRSRTPRDQYAAKAAAIDDQTNTEES